MVKKMNHTDLPTAVNFFLLVVTLGTYGFYFLHRESKKNGFLLKYEKQSKIMLIAAGSVYCLSVLVFNWLDISNPGQANHLLNLSLCIAMLSYCILYIYGYLHKRYISRLSSERPARKGFSILELFLFIGLGTLFISIRQNQIAENENESETKTQI